VNFLSHLEAKRDGQILSADQIKEIVLSYMAGSIPDYQMAAFLMAVYFRGLNRDETRALTLAMRDSGEQLHFPPDPRPLVDKHSSGGVGDKVSLPLAPLLACLGFRVPMVSGRGLGITGGTLDKLESIPGFQTALTSERLVEIVQSIGCVICGQSAAMVPADQRLYALRDVTGTVPSIALLTTSILSKKLAENLTALVLDVKFGSGASMPTLEHARPLAQGMVDLATECGVNTRALLTDMNAPLGCAVGNWLEIKEAVATLEQRGPDDLLALVLECAGNLLVQTQKATNREDGRVQAARCIASGEPRKKWDEMLAAQGADLDAFNQKLLLEHPAAVVMDCHVRGEGFIGRCDARGIGEMVRDLGGGRLTKETVINREVGVDRLAKAGAVLGIDSILGRIHAATEGQAREACERLKRAFEFSPRPLPAPPLVQEVIG
jgi:pyrimidine-nucleoside phosphorylase